MPVYEYKCNRCGHITEALQKISDTPLEKCEACGGPVKRIISQNSFHLKGTGWYVTDYASKSSEKKPESKAKKSQTGNKDEKKASKKESSEQTQ